MSTKQKLELSEQLGEIIPLDPETCNDIIEYGLSLKTEQEITEHFLNLLGESDATMAFLNKFMNVKISPKATKKVVVPDFKSETKKVDNKIAWTASSEKQYKEKIPKEPVSKETKSKASTTTSELLKSKAPEKKDNRKSRKKNLDNLKDLEQLINGLEIQHSNDSLSVCHCNATRHPLFELAPNCLNCGKIICAKEGLQPCSFCGHDVISNKEKEEIRQVLVQEKLELERKQSPFEKEKETPKSKPKKIVFSMNAGENLWKAQDAALKKAEHGKKQHEQEIKQKQKDQLEQEQQESEFKYYNAVNGKSSDLIAAKERLNTLLGYQENGEERTKIIDNAADYELATNSGNMWLSATERALRLKKQQKQLRKYEENEQKRIGKGNRTVEMVIKDGKVTMVEKYNQADDEDEDNDIKNIENEIKQDKRSKEGELASNVWDYEADQNKWEKPVYIQHKTDQETFKKHRVQFDSIDQTDLVVSMY